MGPLHEDLRKFILLFGWMFLWMRKVSHKICREYQNTHILFNNIFAKLAVYDNVEYYGTARQGTEDSITGRKRVACWITKATDTRSECVIHTAFLRQQWLRERGSVLRYTDSA
jgi:hypothetical protein